MLREKCRNVLFNVQGIVIRYRSALVELKIYLVLVLHLKIEQEC